MGFRILRQEAAALKPRREHHFKDVSEYRPGHKSLTRRLKVCFTAAYPPADLYLQPSALQLANVIVCVYRLVPLHPVLCLAARFASVLYSAHDLSMFSLVSTVTES